MVPRSDRRRAARRWEPSVHATASAEGGVDAREGFPDTLPLQETTTIWFLEVMVTQTGLLLLLLFLKKATNDTKETATTRDTRRAEDRHFKPHTQMEKKNDTSSRTSTDGTAHLGAPDIPKVHPQTHAKSPAGGNATQHNTTTQEHVKLLWVTLQGNHREMIEKSRLGNPLTEKPHVSC